MPSVRHPHGAAFLNVTLGCSWRSELAQRHFLYHHLCRQQSIVSLLQSHAQAPPRVSTAFLHNEAASIPLAPSTPTGPLSASSDSQSSPPPPSSPSFWIPFLTLLSLFPILFAVDDAIVTVATVHGRSMQPTLNSHLPSSALSATSSAAASSSSSLDVVLIWKMSSQASSSFRPGALLVLKSPYTPTRALIKRLIGREGDWIATQHRASRGRDSDGEESLGGEYGQIELIGKGRVWVEGENEVASAEDSREYGQMPAALIQGRVLAVVWPPARMRWVENTLQHVGGERRLRNRILAW